jgi:hypothetical protein
MNTPLQTEPVGATVPQQAAARLNASRDERLAAQYHIVNHGVYGYEVQTQGRPVVFNQHKHDQRRNWHAALNWARENVEVKQ